MTTLFLQRKEQMVEIQTQLDRYKIIADTSPVPVVLMSRDGNNVYTNSAYQKMLECNLNDLLHRNWENFVHPDDLMPVRSGWLNFVSTVDLNGSANCKSSIRFVTKTSKTLIDAEVFIAHIPGDGFVGYIVPLNNDYLPWAKKN